MYLRVVESMYIFSIRAIENPCNNNQELNL